ncbi:lantibiotic dehydratase [Streptomyces spiralis]
MTRYRPTDTFLLRAPVLPADVARDLMAAHPEETSRRLLEHTREPPVRRALLVASPDLLDAVDRIGTASAKRAARVRSRLLRYLTRMSTRPTPFGVFAGVAGGRFGDRATLRLGLPVVARTRVRPDLGWLLSLIERVEADPELLPALLVVANTTVYAVGDRLVLPYADVYGRRDGRAVRVRATSAVELALRTAEGGVPYDRLVATLAAAFPQTPEPVVRGLVRRLWDLNFLTSDLRPPLTGARPDRHVLSRLEAVRGAEAVTVPLRKIAAAADCADDEAALRELGRAQAELLPDHDRRTVQVDSALAVRGRELPRAIGEAVADAAGCLMRLRAALPPGNAHIARYREAFLDRYGIGTRVPLLELLSPDLGLDAPAGYTAPPPQAAPSPPPPDTARYDRVLTELAAQAWWSGVTEVELTDDWLDRLAPPGGPRTPGYPVLDVYAQVEAAGTDTLDRGEWRVVLRPDSLAPGGRAHGRFFELLSEDDRRGLRDLARQEEELLPDVVHAELTYLPTNARAANVAVRPLLRQYEIAVNTSTATGQDRTIGLDDILVGATTRRLYLWSRRLDREIRVCQQHMLVPRAAPNVARFLLDVSEDGYVMPGGFRWGPLERMPLLPRVVRNRVVLRPAQWTLLRQPGRPLDDKDLDAWRARWRVPRHVYLVDGDHRLLLDLDHPLYRAELRRELDAGGRAVLHEMLPDFGGLWLGDARGRRHTQEIVVPLLADGAAVAGRDRVRAQPQVRPVRHPPGGPWSFLKLYAPFDRHDEIIAGPLRELVAGLRARGIVDRWFYLRYADPRPHLRIRLRGPAEELLTPLTAWGLRLVEQGLAQDTALASYDPETARYGGPRTFDAIERFFEANSDATAALLAMRTGPGACLPPRLTPEFTAVAALDILYAQWGLAPAERLYLVPDGQDDGAGHGRYRDNRTYLCALLVPWDLHPHPEGRADHQLLAGAFAGQRPAARSAAEAVRRAARDGTLVGSEQQVLHSLAHMQINRLMPATPPGERRCYTIWRQVLRAVGGRPAAHRPGGG